MRIWDLDKFSLAEIKDTVNRCNEMTDAVLATGESWDDWMKRSAPEVDIIVAVWRAPETKRGFKIGFLKGQGTLILLSQLPQTGSKTLKFMYCRFANEQIAWATSALYGDDRAEAEAEGNRHFLAEMMSKGSRQEAARRAPKA